MDEKYDPKVLELARRVREGEYRETLERLLALRFGQLPPAYRSRIAEADGTSISVWFRRLAHADTLEEALEEPSKPSP